MYWLKGLSVVAGKTSEGTGVFSAEMSQDMTLKSLV